jgi:hypothetical protein
MVRDRGSTEILKFTKRGMGEEGRRPSCIALIGLRVRVYVYVYVPALPRLDGWLPAPSDDALQLHTEAHAFLSFHSTVTPTQLYTAMFKY